MFKKIAIIGLLFSILSFSFFYLKSKKESVALRLDETVDTVREVKETLIPQPTKILSDGLPDKHLIKADFLTQAPEKDWSQPWQDACEEASMLIVDYYYKNIKYDNTDVKNALLAMIDYETNQGWSKDIDLEKMSYLAKDYLKYNSEVIDNPGIEIIKKYIAKDIPVIITANGKTLYKENRHFSSGGPYYHSLVILGFDDTRQQFIVHDVGTQHGRYFRYSYDLLMESIHDFPLSGHKEDIDSGAKRVLVLLK